MVATMRAVNVAGAALTTAAGTAGTVLAGPQWGAAAASASLLAWDHLGRVNVGQSWADVVGRAARDVIARQPQFTGPDGSRPTLESWQPVADGGIVATGWAGAGAGMLAEWVAKELPAKINERNKLRLALGDRYVCSDAWVVEDYNQPGRVTLHLRRMNPLWELRPWPAPPGETPMSGFAGDWAFGYNARGDLITLPLWGAESPHILLSGSPGGGKSNLLNLLLMQALGLNLRQREVFVLGCDFKMGMEFGPWRDAMSLVITDPKDALAAFQMAYRWLEARGYRLAAQGDQKPARFGPGQCGMFVCVDEGSLLPPAAMEALNKLAAIGRALGCVVCVATQYPLAKTFEGLNKPLFGVRFCGRLDGGLQQSKVALGDDPKLTADWGPHTRGKDPRMGGVIYADIGAGLDRYKTFYVDPPTRDANIAALRGTAPGPQEFDVALDENGQPVGQQQPGPGRRDDQAMPAWFRPNVVETTGEPKPKRAPARGRPAKQPA
jgi:hypothetical protein